ncbi:MAG: hypothetical protein HN423_02595 [Alphaproteobacteria bacterium]|nr:hypothetical protein [Alphaproteobacteria bacterium]
MVQVEVAQSEVEPDFQALEEALDTLPPKLCAPLRLKYMEGMSYDEIADVLGIGVSAAKMRTMRARKQMLELLKP